ncbi:MAG: NADH-quinone oxidoreductase subunit M [Bdellovibrionales bacterium]|nr:NADH-quinone oxidoreductase subunit M [Bdellovibrionales bacterium]
MNLIWIVAWPFLAGLILFLFGKNKGAAQWANLVFQLVWVGILVAIWSSGTVDFSATQMPISFSWDWLPELKSRFSLGVDGLSGPLVILNVFLAVVLALYSLGKESLGSGYLGLFAILNGASVGSLLAADALCFYFFWEFMLIPMYFLIGRWGSKNRVYAALKFFAFTMAGSLLMLLAIVALALMSSVPSLGWHDLVHMQIPFAGWGSSGGLLFLAFVIAFAVKVPVWPVHAWLPDAHTEAPTGASVILAGILLKLGVYGMARWCLPLFPQASLAAAPCMMILGCVGVVFGSLAAWRQSDVKKMIAYSSVAHLGFMVIGLFGAQTESIQGAMFQNIAHGLSTGALFLIFGIIYDRTHTREIAQYGGLASKAPVLASLFVFAVMASIGLPGLPGFVGEFLVLSGSFVNHPVAAMVASSGVLLGAVYMLSLVRRTMFGPQGPTVVSHEFSLRWNEWAAVVPFVFAMLYFGLRPQGILNQADKAVETLMAALR